MATCTDPEGGPALSGGHTVSKGPSGLCREGQHKDAIREECQELSVLLRIP